MTFDETIAFLTEQIGRSVEAGIEVRFPDDSVTTHVGTAAGRIDAEIEAHPVPEAEQRTESGTWWTLTIHQRNVKFDLVLYV